ncbi:Alpha-(1,3)-fucosyltransferase B [Lucilia cuprina]|uniref:Fucosyltransferase n=1 Tax=Lucilia cuprina TaxID=7375 RepID=A0A0L0BV76_LUCCU|nr:3 fucosyltransferase B, Alpha 1 [Lucilia cuprina]KNC23937.1 Alpha-(1,3)-fucosyltransferase B [Lucilia cuprina]
MLNLSLNKWKKLLLLIILIALIVIILGQLWQDHDEKKSHVKGGADGVPLIIWWTPLMSGYTETRMCDKYICKFTALRDEVDKAKAFLYYGSDIKIDDFPLPRKSHQLWGLMHEESPRNVAFMPYNDWLQHFNLTSTFSRHSDLPMTTYYLPHSDNLTTPAFTVPIGEKSRHKNQALVLFMQSDCDTMSGRDDYVKELMNYISVDSFGACLNNKELPESLQKIQQDYLNHLYAPELLKFMARYKFIIAYENGVCQDYITEKFWRPLIAGSIPIYFGSPSIKDWSPNEKSFIDISNFSSPKALATYLKELDANDRAYNSYLNHKYNMLQPITNKLLLNELGRRKSAMYTDNQFQSFECAVCSYLHEHDDTTQKHFANEQHYQCPHEPVYPPMSNKASNYDDWHSVMSIGKCKAALLDRLFKRNKNYTKDEFMDLLTKEVTLGKC